MRFSELFRRARANLSGYFAGRQARSGASSVGDRSSSLSRSVIERLAGNVLRDDEEDEFELSQLDASYDDQDWSALRSSEVRVVRSSNVYSYAFELENRESGTLFVTFLDWSPGMKSEDRSGPGATYAYYDFPLSKFNQFSEMAATTAGGAVWEYCRVHHTMHEHQHAYRLIQVAGDYVPRKVTARGFKSRTFIAPGIGPQTRKRAWKQGESHVATRKFFKRSSLANQSFSAETIARNGNRVGPNRGSPNRGTS